MTAVSTTTGAALHAFIQTRRVEDEHLFGVVDAARDSDLAFEGHMRFGWRQPWLFDENTAPQMKDVAPYLVPIAFEPEWPYEGCAYLDLWAEHLGSAAGILLLTDAGVDEVREHLCAIFCNRAGQEEEPGYLRFYDPRVLRKLLPGYAPEEAKAFFGPIRMMLVEAESPNSLLVCRVEQDALQMDEEPIPPLEQEEEEFVEPYTHRRR